MRGVAVGAAIQQFGRDCLQQEFPARLRPANVCMRRPVFRTRAKWFVVILGGFCKLRITTCQINVCPLGVSVPWARLGLRSANARNAMIWYAQIAATASGYPLARWFAYFVAIVRCRNPNVFAIHVAFGFCNPRWGSRWRGHSAIWPRLCVAELPALAMQSAFQLGLAARAWVCDGAGILRFGRVCV